MTTLEIVRKLVKEYKLQTDKLSEIEFCIIYDIAQRDLLQQQLDELKGVKNEKS